MEITKEILRNAVGVAVLEISGVNDMLLRSSDNRVMQYAKLGLGWTAVDDALVMLDHGQSHAQNLDGVWYLDQTAFNSAMIAGLDISGVAQRINDASKNVLPFGEYNNYVVDGGLKVLAKSVRATIDQNWSDSPITYVSHVSKWWGW